VSFFEYMMRRAAPVLFWTSVLLLVGTVAASLLLQREASPYSGDSALDARALLNAIVQGLSAAVWPFMGAGLIWTLGKHNGGDQ